MKQRVCSLFLTLALVCAVMVFPASAAGTPVVDCLLAPDGFSVALTLEGVDLSPYGVQLVLNAGTTGLVYTFAPAAKDPGLASQVAVQPNGSGETITLYLTSPYALGEGSSVPIGTLSANGKLVLPEQGTLILLDAQLARHEYTVALRTEGGETPPPTPSPDPDPVPSPGGSSGGEVSGGNSNSSSTESRTISADSSGQATLTQADLKSANGLTVKGSVDLSFDAAALKVLQSTEGSVRIGAAARTESTRTLKAQLGGAVLYDITLAAGDAPLDLGGTSMRVSVPFIGNGTPVVYAVGEDGRLSKIGSAQLEGGKAIFSLTGNIPDAVAVLNVAQVFSDVNGWYDGYVNTVASSGVMKGMEDGSFQPNKAMTRAELVTTLYRMSGDSAGTELGFQDVSPDDWFADAVSWAKKSGVTAGVSDLAFAPHQNITREQMAVMLLRHLTYKGVTLTQETEAAQFADEKQISSFARDAVVRMQRAGIFSGKGEGRFDPKGTATRAEYAKMLAIVLQDVK